MAGTSYQVAIVDDDRITRESLRILLPGAGGFSCWGLFRTGNEALAAFTVSVPDLVLLDLFMPGLPGLECARQIATRYPTVRIIVVTASYIQDRYETALRLGVHGYLMKPVRAESLHSALLGAVAGLRVTPQCAPLPRDFARERPVDPGETFPDLSNRERQILRLLRLGRTTTAIAAGLSIQPCTADTYLRRLFRKLGVHSRAEAVAVAQDHVATSLSVS